MTLLFMDCEAYGGSPKTGELTEFGAVALTHMPAPEEIVSVQEYVLTLPTFHGIIIDSEPNPDNLAVPLPKNSDPTRAKAVFEAFRSWLGGIDGSFTFVSDNVAFDWQWINCGSYEHLGYNPLGHSGRRISDYYAGLIGDWRKSLKWKSLRITKHDHNPVHDARGNVEAFIRIQMGER
jgi:hypothetical protein